MSEKSRMGCTNVKPQTNKQKGHKGHFPTTLDSYWSIRKMNPLLIQSRAKLGEDRIILPWFAVTIPIQT